MPDNIDHYYFKLIQHQRQNLDGEHLGADAERDVISLHAQVSQVHDRSKRVTSPLRQLKFIISLNNFLRVLVDTSQEVYR